MFEQNEKTLKGFAARIASILTKEELGELVEAMDSDPTDTLFYELLEMDVKNRPEQYESSDGIGDAVCECDDLEHKHVGDRP